MKTATVRDLRNHYSGLLEWIEAGEEIRITRRGKPIARLVPEPEAPADQVDWSLSPAVGRDRSGEDRLTAEEAQEVIKDSSGRW